VTPTDLELLAYLDEALSVVRSATIERQLREQPELRLRAAQLARCRDQGGHSVGEIWRRERLTCQSREQLSLFLAGRLSPGLTEYIQFHLSVVDCRYCQANLLDLKKQRAAREPEQKVRHRRYFDSSAGLLRSPAPE